MTSAHQLIDLAKNRCDGQTYAALARRVGLTPQVIHMWKVGDAPLSAERVAELCKIAGENPENWKILILAEQSKGEEKKTWESVIKRLGIAASIILFFAAASAPAPALADGHFADERSGQAMHYAKLKIPSVKIKCN